MSEFFVTNPEGDAVVSVDLSFYPLSCVQGAAYRFTDRCHVFLTKSDERPSGALALVLSPKRADCDLKALVGEFFNELLDQRVRERVREESGQLRELIVAQAFAEGNLLEEVRDAHGDGDADFGETPPC